MNIKYKFLTFTLFILCIPACQDKHTELKDTIRQYNNLLSAGYDNLSMTKLTNIATKDQAVRVYQYMAAMGEGRAKMNARLSSIVFLNIVMETPDRAKIKTEEFWQYNYKDIDTGAILVNNTIHYILNYHLVKSTGLRRNNNHRGWLVANIDIIKNDPSREEQKLPFLQRPQFTTKKTP